tara:strand:- start:25 stop:207 length:183 start_codon:yes stop_codon:yes gene_type:complete
MTPIKYKILRKQIGNQERVAGLLGLSRLAVQRRESDQTRITEEAAIAITELSKRHRKPKP